MKDARITVLLVVHNRTRFLAEALASVGAQSRRDWQLIVSDSSTDPVAAGTVREIVETQPEGMRERCLLRQHGKALSHAEHLEAAWPLVETPFFALLDDDDVWLPHHLADAAAWLEADDRRGLSMHGSTRIDAEGRVLGPNAPLDVPPAEQETAAWLRYKLQRQFSATSGYVFRFDFIRAHVFLPTPCVDTHLAITTLLHGGRIGGDYEPGFLYRVHGGTHYPGAGRVMLQRHELRLMLARRHFFAISRRVPVFPMLAAKSWRDARRLRSR